MANSTNNEWVEPTNIPEQIRDIHWTDDVFNDVIDALVDATTLSGAESAINIAFENDIFLKNL